MVRHSKRQEGRRLVGRNNRKKKGWIFFYFLPTKMGIRLSVLARRSPRRRGNLELIPGFFAEPRKNGEKKERKSPSIPLFLRGRKSEYYTFLFFDIYFLYIHQEGCGRDWYKKDSIPNTIFFSFLVFSSFFLFSPLSYGATSCHVDGFAGFGPETVPPLLRMPTGTESSV